LGEIYYFLLKIKRIHAVARRNYNSMPTEQNSKFLDINLSITGYNCGLFEYDWSLFKMVRIKFLKIFV
jgi:hypothetical protein